MNGVNPLEIGAIGLALLIAFWAVRIAGKMIELKLNGGKATAAQSEREIEQLEKFATEVAKAVGIVAEQAVRDLKDHFDPMLRQTTELHEWHKVADEDGVKVWYVRRSLEKAVDRLADAVETANTLGQEQVRLLQTLTTNVRELRPDS
jgi:archaellum component FlaC